MRMRFSLSIITLLALGPLNGQAATPAAAHYPNKPIRLIVPYPQGGGADHWGRLVAAQLSNTLGQPVQVDNIPGAGGNNGTTAAAGAAPDGYTLLLGSVGPLTVHPYTYRKLHFNAARDFVPIALLESSPILLVGNPAVPASSAAELIALARKDPGGISYASNGDGSPEEVAGEVFKKRLGVQLKHIPYDGAGPARKAVLAGQAALMFDPCKGALPAIQTGRQKPFAVAAATRLPQLPNTPTFAELGVRKYELRIWTGVLAPAGTPVNIVNNLNKAVREALQSTAMRNEIMAEGGEAGDTNQAQFAEFIQAERRHWFALVAESGIPKVQVQ